MLIILLYSPFCEIPTSYSVASWLAINLRNLVTAVATVVTYGFTGHQDSEMDLYFVLDSSASIGSTYYDKAKTFLADLVSHFTIGEDNVRVGLVIYGSSPYLTFDLHESFNKDDNVGRIQSAEYLSSSTATGDAILLMANEGFTEEHGARSVDYAVPRVALVLTDGASNCGTSVSEAAKSARDKSIEIHAFGIGGSINNIELLEIAGSQDKVHMIDSFKNINDAKALISRGFYRGNEDL